MYGFRGLYTHVSGAHFEEVVYQRLNNTLLNKYEISILPIVNHQIEQIDSLKFIYNSIYLTMVIPLKTNEQ